MTRDEAIAIRITQLQGGFVTAGQLQEALYVIETTRPRCGREYKYKLPDLPQPVREHANTVLAFNLGLAIGRAQR